MDERVMSDVVSPILQLRRRGQFAMQEQIRGFQVGAFFREVFDGITAITQDAGVAIDVCDLADAGGGVIEGRVVAHHAKIFGVNPDLAEVGGTDGAVRDGELVGFAGAIVGDGERFAGRGRALELSRRSCRQWGVHWKILGAVVPRFRYHCTPKGAPPETGRRGDAKFTNTKSWLKAGSRGRGRGRRGAQIYLLTMVVVTSSMGLQDSGGGP